MAPQQRRPTASATAEDAAPLLLPSAAPPSPPRFAGAPEARPHPDLPGSRRERLAFVLGGSLTALLSLLLLLLLGGGGRRPSSSYHAAGNGGLDPDDAGRSLLLPALGSAGADAYLRSRRGRFGTLAQWGRGEEGRSRPDCCTNPASYDPDAAYYNMTEGTGFLQPWSKERRGGHFRSLLDEGRGDGGRKRLRDRADRMREKMGWDSAAGGWRNATSRNRPAPRSIAFLHVGKAGGSSLLCNLRESFRYGKVHCPGYVHGAHTKYPLAFEDDSYLSRQVTCYVHYDERLYCYDAEAFLVNVRNPVHRLASWYLYEHAANYGALVNRELFPDRPIHCGQNMLYGCYATLDDMATLGLAGDGWDGRGGGTNLRVGRDLSELECRRWAQAAARGAIPASYHNFWNYEWYLDHLLSGRDAGGDGAKKEIFVLRVEHLDEDWSEVDRIVGGTGDALPASRSHANEAAEKPLPVSNRTISAGGMANLCRALCGEIQVYKKILSAAANLDERKLEETMGELRETCPEETSLEPRDCDRL